MGFCTWRGASISISIEGLQPVYTEYNIGHYRRSSQLSNKIDKSQISAAMKDGV